MKAKRFLSMILCMTLVFTLLPMTARAAAGDTGVDGDYAWRELDDGTVAITLYTGSGGALSIPVTLDGKIVTEIGNGAFYDTPITALTIPDSVETIGNDAFSWCGSLSSLTKGRLITTVGEDEIRGGQLTTLDITNSVETIGAAAFAWCGSLSSLTLGSG